MSRGHKRTIEEEIKRKCHARKQRLKKASDQLLDMAKNTSGQQADYEQFSSVSSIRPAWGGKIMTTEGSIIEVGDRQLAPGLTVRNPGNVLSMYKAVTGKAEQIGIQILSNPNARMAITGAAHKHAGKIPDQKKRALAHAGIMLADTAMASMSKAIDQSPGTDVPTPKPPTPHQMKSPSGVKASPVPSPPATPNASDAATSTRGGWGQKV